MRLAEIVNNILSTKKRDDNSTHGRREQRFDIRAPLMMRLLTAGDIASPPLKVWLRNLSADGCCIVSQRRMKPGQKFLLRMPNPEGDGEIDMCYESVRCSMVADEVFHIGAKRAAAPEKPAVAAKPAAKPAASPAADAEAHRIRAAMFGG